jgi:sterol O-acyltransferase
LGSGLTVLNICRAVFLGAAIWIPLKESLVHNLPPASAVTLLMEQVRLVMKTHAFVRSNIPVALFYFNQRQSRDERTSVEDDANQAPCPDFSKYLYFMFAPTLVYRDRYPRYFSFFFLTLIR